MKRFSSRFLTLLLVLLSIGAFDLHAFLDNAQHTAGSWSSAYAAPLPILGARSTKPRVGIVVKPISAYKSGSSSSASTSPLNTQSTGGSAFNNPDGGRMGMTVQLKRLEHNPSADPLMLFQRHVNKATSKLASILGRDLPSEEQLNRALQQRRESVLERRGLKDTSPRQGYTKQNEASRMERRFLSSLMSDIFGGKSRSAAKANPADGYPEADLTASQSDNFTPASAPTAIQSLGLDIESNDIGYVATIQIGSQNTSFRMLIDSGSADTWVPSTQCQACGSTHTQLGSSDSDTFEALNTPFSNQYGTGNVMGNLAVDNLNVANLSLTNYTFAVTTQESPDFSEPTFPFDGLMGLARSELSNAGQPTPIDALYDQGKVQVPVMGYHLGRVADGYNDGEVTFGGVDPAKFTGNLTEIPNVSKQGF